MIAGLIAAVRREAERNGQSIGQDPDVADSGSKAVPESSKERGRESDPPPSPTARMRPIHEIAQDVHACATAWVPEARLVGNVRADEVAYLAECAMSVDLDRAVSNVSLTRSGVAKLEARIAAGYAALQVVVAEARKLDLQQHDGLRAALTALDDTAEPRPTEGCSACAVGIGHTKCPTAVP